MKEGNLSRIQHDDGLLKVQLVSKDSKRLIGVGANVMSVHMLHPYQSKDNIEGAGWDEFRLRIQKALNAYRKVTDAESVVRVGVRYINRITIPETSSRIKDYLRCINLKLEGLPENYGNFYGRVEYKYEDDVQLNLIYGLLNSSSNKVECLLDLDAFWQYETSIDCDESMKATALKSR